MNGLALLLGFIASALVIANSLPQTVKIWRSGSDVGVNVAMWFLFYSLLCIGLGYGLRVGNVTLVIANLGTMLTGGSVMVAIARANHRSMWFAALRLLLLAVILVTLALVVPKVVLSVVFVSGSGLAWMQAYTSFKTWRLGRDSTVSITTFALRSATQVAWILQCTITGDMTLMLIATITLVAAMTTIVFEVLTEGRRRTLASSHVLA